ncbi:MAG: carbon-nitrogen hydrolase family protein [Acidobacteria bacterium]|nr:carbon-nitrogen hydrolase family protein [Acidobacteriota bacterium]
MNPPGTPVTPVTVVAVVQAAPVWLNLEQSLARAVDLIAEAARRQAHLVVFPELWLPGYPAWLDLCRDVSLAGYAPMKRLYARLQENSVVIPGRVTEALSDVSRRHQLTLVIGVQERVEGGPGRGTLYNTVLTFGPRGELLNRHRKLSPTFNEKLLWAPGDGQGMRVVATPLGRLGASIGSEHWMPLVRQSLHAAGEELHVALWPSVGELSQIASRHYALEGRCFVVAAGGIMRPDDLPRDLELSAKYLENGQPLPLDGGSAVIGPDGQYVAGPTFGSEVILLARINQERIREESLELGTPGHDARPDLFDFRLRDVAGDRARNAMAAPVAADFVDESRAGKMAGAPPRALHDQSEQELLLSSGTDGASFRVIPSSRVINFDPVEP